MCRVKSLKYRPLQVPRLLTTNKLMAYLLSIMVNYTHLNAALALGKQTNFIRNWTYLDWTILGDLLSIIHWQLRKFEKPLTACSLEKHLGQMVSQWNFSGEVLWQAFPITFEYVEAFSHGQLPQKLRLASICLIPKKDKDPLRCESYRPISLLNMDCKILAKCLAKCLELVLPSLISSDQTGFIQGRHSFSNTHRLLDIMYTQLESCSPEIIVALKCRKGFDRSEWGFLFDTLLRFGFGPTFISWVKLLYSGPLALVRTNEVQSRYIPLYRGTRQGCPLSPLLFDLVIEPLAVSLRQCHSFEGITWGERVHKVSLYADDLFLYVTNPAMSLPPNLSKLEAFGKLSGYKVNMQKSEDFPLNPTALNIPASVFPFKRVTSHFKYQGITVPRSFQLLYKLNFFPLIDKCKQNLQRGVLTCSKWLWNEFELLKICILRGYSHYSLNWQENLASPSHITSVIFILGILSERVTILSLSYRQRHP